MKNTAVLTALLGLIASLALAPSAMAADQDDAVVGLGAVDPILDQRGDVDVVVGERRARGRIEGLGERNRYRCRIQFDRPEDEVAVGDEVFTSGLGKKFPDSILIGYVSKISDQEFGLHQEGEVTPSVDFTRLDEVLILTSGPKETDAL